MVNVWLYQLTPALRSDKPLAAPSAVAENIVLGGAHEVIADTALRAAQVDEIQGAAIGHQNPNEPPFDHVVEIAGPGLLLQLYRQLIVGRCGRGDVDTARQQQRDRNASP